MTNDESLVEMRRLHAETMQALDETLRILRNLERQIMPSADVGIADDHQRIYACIKQRGPMSAREIAQHTHITTVRVRIALTAMVNGGTIFYHVSGKKTVYEVA